MNEEYDDLSINEIDYVIDHLVHDPKKTKIEYKYTDFENYEKKELTSYPKKMIKFNKNISHLDELAKDYKDMIIMKDTKIVELQNRIKELVEENNELKIELETFKAMEN
jgi:myosin heavy subunit